MENLSNIKAAVRIIAALSLLLGLSLGQNHLQYSKIKNLEAQRASNLVQEFKFNVEKKPIVGLKYYRCQEKRALQAEARARQAEMRALEKMIRTEQAIQERELRKHVDQLRKLQVEVQVE